MNLRHRTSKRAQRIRVAGLAALGFVLFPTLLTAAYAQKQPAVPARPAIPYPRPAAPEQLEFFEKKVRPILVGRCYNCHSNAFKAAGGLRVDTGIGFFTGGNTGPLVVPGSPEQSLLITRVKATDVARRMPKESPLPLPAEEIAIMEAWVKDGAAWPDETEKAPQAPAFLKEKYDHLKAKWWSWQPLKYPTPPAVKNKAWPASPVDRFVLAKLEANRLAPVADAEAATLIRRVTFDLTGLPPTPPEVKAFTQDHSPKAYAALVDRLLASPQFGERWGRHWLDLARYGESSGPSRNIPYPHAWRYRDYVIDAYNSDTPYNRFLQEQIAGDLLTASPGEERDRLTIATGFLALGPKDVNQRFAARFKMDNVDEVIDTVTRSTIALTVSCARCHDHKFDPIPTKDYYALAGIFASSQDGAGLGSGMGGAGLFYYKPKQLGYLSTAPAAPAEQKPVSTAAVDSARKELADLNRQIAAEQKANPGRGVTPEDRRQRQALQRKIRMATEEAGLAGDLGDQGYGIHCIREGEVSDTSIRIRGEEERRGPVVPRGYLSIASIPGSPAIPADHSGRLELSQWITAPENPLTTRVYVNRVWQHLFGAGLVRTVDNFGSTGDSPSHPELLDYLARDFVRKGWSTKRLVRDLVLTRAYRLGGAVPAGYKEKDPDNRLIWRHSPRRLETEEIRDGILASSGRLDLQRPKGSATMSLRMIEIRDDGPVVQSVLQAADRSAYRSVYLPQVRGSVPRPLAAFDPVTQTLVTGKRETTVVPAQALFVLNSPFVREQSARLAVALLADPHGTDALRVTAAYQRVLSRDPSPREIAKASAFLREYADVWSKGRPEAPATASEPPAVEVETESNGPAAGVARSDRLDQDDADDTPNAAVAQTAALLQPRAPQQAAWTAFIQALYGSAEFQFLR